jgi:hypothetical protein
MKPNERNMGALLASDDNSCSTGTELFVDGGSAQVSALIADGNGTKNC